MALFGAQLVMSMIMASFLQKLMPYYSFSRWLLCNWLVRYLHPTDEELRTVAGIPSQVSNKKHKNRRSAKELTNGAKKIETFTVPKKLDLRLDAEPVMAIDVIQLHFYSDYHWLLEFSVCSTVLYILTEIYYLWFQPKMEFNLSMLWCFLVILFSLKILYSLTAMYFRTEDSSERIMCAMFGFFFLVASMGVLIIDEGILEFGLVPAYQNFSAGAEEFLRMQGMESTGPASFVTFKLILAVISAILGACITFPGLRFARTYIGSLKYSNPGTQVLLHINFLLPLLVTICWVKPIMRDFLTGQNERRKIITDKDFDTIRLWLIVLACVLRIALAPIHFQAYLNIAQEKVEDLKKEAGRISNIDLQRLVARIFYYLCVAALQYITPAILLLFTTFMLKTLSEQSWINVDIVPIRNATSTNSSNLPVIDVISDTAAQFTIALSSLRKVFTATVFKGIFSYLCWWLCVSWSTTSIFGVLYHTYFVQ